MTITSMRTAPAPVPPWVHLLPSRTVYLSDGRGPYHVANAAQIISASMTNGPVLVDEGLMTAAASAAGREAPALGWIAAMEARQDGLWANVAWTPRGAQLVSDRSYTSVMPKVELDRSDNIVRILQAGLTNNGAIKGLKPLCDIAMLSARPSGGPVTIVSSGIRQATADEVALCARRGWNVATLVSALGNRTAANGYGLSEMERMVCKQMNVSLTAFAAEKAMQDQPEDTWGLSLAEQQVCRQMGTSMKEMATMKWIYACEDNILARGNPPMMKPAKEWRRPTDEELRNPIWRH